MSEIPVHNFITASPTELTVTGTTTTEITLHWSATSQGGAVGYRVCWGQSVYPVLGRNPIDGPDYTDIALSAGRDYTFRVCPVDLLGFDGPCSEVPARTEYSQ